MFAKNVLHEPLLPETKVALAYRIENAPIWAKIRSEMSHLQVRYRFVFRVE
jgi:hypothetical protein